eukprot:snap_masked-scaffold_3-processed-gene-17.8-mRNA-1 protein AED:1.00 eAED:1.00 QI:0/0/0/0/1/1/2/0/68
MTYRNSYDLLSFKIPILAKIFKARNWNSPRKLKGRKIHNSNRKDTKKKTNLTKTAREKILTKKSHKKV